MYDFAADALLIVTMFSLIEHYRFDELSWLRRSAFTFAFITFFALFSAIVQIRISGPAVNATVVTIDGLLGRGWIIGTIALLIAAGYREGRDWVRVVCFACAMPWLFELLVIVAVSLGWNA